MTSQSKALIGASITAAVFWMCASLWIPSPPTASDSGDEVVRYFVQHGDAIKFGVFLGVFALVAFMVSVALIRERLPNPLSTVFLVGGVVTATAIMGSFWFVAALTLHPRTLDPSVARTVFDIYSFFGPFLTASTMVMLGAVLAAAWTQKLPTWFVILTLVVLAEQFVETATVFGTDGFTEPGGAMNLKLGATLFMAWFVATAVVLARRPVDAPRDAVALH